ncbi:hypothetical protein EV121DRAFT_254946 [Schizophyllum commune]
MLASFPIVAPPGPPQRIQARGRSRQVSRAAVARKASEERRVQARRLATATGHDQQRQHTYVAHKRETTTQHQSARVLVPEAAKTCRALPTSVPFKATTRQPLPSAPRSCSPPPHLSASRPNSPPTPPTPSAPTTPSEDADTDAVSLADRVHTAYALEDMHTAKILLLKLKGYRDITEADIAAVKDEDFDFCFVPNGRLVEDISAPCAVASSSTMPATIKAQTREERLKACEKVWEDGRRAMAESRQAVLLKQKRARFEREMAERRRLEAEAEERRLEAERILMVKQNLRRRQRPVVSYAELSPTRTSPTPTRHRSPTLYDCPPLQPAPSHSRQKSSLSMSLDQPVPEMSQVVVPFKDVVRSMHGQLFPHDSGERLPHTRSSPSPSTPHATPTRKERREKELLTSLLTEAEVVAAEAEKRWKGKGAAVSRRGSVACPACEKSKSSSSLSSTTSGRSLSSTSSGPSRSGSWLSFSSASSFSSVSTALTTPATSPMVTSPPKRRSVLGSWLLKPTVSEPAEIAVTRRYCPTHRRSHLTSVPVHDSPLPFPVSEPAVANESRSAARADGDVAPSTYSPKIDAQAGLVSQVLSYAQNFQRAYAGALLFSSVPTASPYEFNEPARRKQGAASRRSGRSVRAPGYRASKAEVSTVFPMRHVTIRRQVEGDGWDQASDFLAADDDGDAIEIPLVAPAPPALQQCATTAFNPFNPHGLGSRNPSPLRRQLLAAVPPSAGAGMCTTVRVKVVQNPLYLRLKATHNVLARRRGVAVRDLDSLQGKAKEKIGRVVCIAVPVVPPPEGARSPSPAEREVYGVC